MALLPVAPDHAELSEQLNALLDGELDTHVRAQVEAHVRDCAACQLELEQLRVTRSAVQTLAILRAPRPFTVTAPATEPAATTWIERLLPWTWRVGGFATAACLLVGAITATLPAGVGQRTSGSTTLASQAAEKSAPARDAREPAQQPAPVAPAAASRQPDAAANSPSFQGAAPADRRSEAITSSAPAPNAASAPAAAAGGSGADASDAARQPGARPPAVAPASAPVPLPAPRRVAPIWFGASGLLALMSAAAFFMDRRGH